MTLNNESKVGVSLVIPAYNAAKYLEQCILSIMSQSYKNIQIIIVDDGSTDGTGSIADKIARQDKRILVIHKENAGVSAARNTGIDNADGEYIAFVDADDYLAPDFVEYMLNIADKTGAEFCLSEVCYTKANEPQTANQTIVTLTPEEATALLLSPKVTVGCWNKMFKKSLLVDRNIRFCTELFYGEGLHFITKVSQEASCIGVGNRKVYYYRRNNQYSATTKFKIESIYNGEKALDIIEHEMLLQDKSVSTMLVLHRSMYSVGALTKLIINKVEKQYRSDYRRWLLYIRKNIPFLFKQRNVSAYRKFLILGCCISPRLMANLDLMRRKRISDNSVGDYAKEM